FPTRELDQTMRPGTFFPMATIFAFSASSGVSAEPRGGAPSDEQPVGKTSASKEASFRRVIARFLRRETRPEAEARGPGRYARNGVRSLQNGAGALRGLPGVDSRARA